MSSSFPLPLSEKEEKAHVKNMEQGDAESRNILIEHNLRLVAHIARKYAGVNTPLEDLISIGTIGLIKAINTYSSERSVKLSSYASKCVENEILMSLRSSKKNNREISISLPIGTDKDGNEISLSDILGTDPDEIINALNLKFQVKVLYNMIDTVLTPREKQIVFLRYGLDGYGPRTQREIAGALKISRSYVSRIEKKALEKLRMEFLKLEK